MLTPISLRSRILRAAVGRRQAKGVGRQSRLEVHALESRDVPSTYVVDDPSDASGTQYGTGTGLTGDLRYCISQANSYQTGLDVITFDAGVFGSGGKITLGFGELTIDDPVTIEGLSDVTISGGDLFRVFNINIGEEEVVLISDLVIADGLTSGNGGGILLQDGTLELTDCIVDDNVAEGDGGGIYAAKVALYLTDCAIRNNQADGNGAGVYSDVITFDVEDTTFASNEAGGDGGGIAASDGDVVLDDCVMEGNIASGDGGAIWATGSSTLYAEDCKIGSESLIANQAIGSGGAIYSEVPTTLISSRFNINIASNGGNIEMATSTAWLFMDSCEVNGEEDPDTIANEGGCIRFRNVSTTTTSIIRDTIFLEGYVKARGGAICIIGTGDVSLESTVAPDLAKSIDSKFVIGSGGAKNQINPTTGKDYGIGGGIYIGVLDDESPTVSISKIRVGFEPAASGPPSIHANYANYGGNIAIEGISTDVSIEDSVFDHGGNHSQSGSANMPMLGGNMIILNTSGDIVINNCQLIGGTATQGVGQGGGMAILNATGKITIDTCVIEGNTASDLGGGIYIVSSSSVTVNKSVVTGNTATNLGGGVFVTGSGTVTLATDTISENTAAMGGGICIGDGDSTIGVAVTVRACSVEANLAIGDSSSTVSGGGGIVVNRAANVIIKNSTINSNLAQDANDNYTLGGGIYFPNSVIHTTTYNIRNCTIWANTAERGGGVFVNGLKSGSTYLRVYNSTVATNSAKSADDDDGGGIGFINFVSGDTVFLSSTIVAKNTATGSGGTQGIDIGGNDGAGDSIHAQYSIIGVAGDSGWSLTSTSTANWNGTLSSPQDPGFSTAGLASNGGPTKTVALANGSKAINNGQNVLNLTSDQRGDDNGTVYPRVNNAYADIGAFESVQEDNG